MNHSQAGSTMDENPPEAKPRRSRIRFSLAGLMWLIAGIAIGFTPGKIWEKFQGKSNQVVVQVEILEVGKDAFPSVGGPTNAILKAGDDAKFLATLRSSQEANVISRPTIMTINGQRATLWIGGEASFDGGGTPVVRTFGFEMDVTPRILPNGRINMALCVKSTALKPELSSTSVPGSSTIESNATLELASTESVVWRTASPDKATKDMILVARVERVEAP